MDKHKIQLIGGPCGHHGSYTFYKAVKYNNKQGQTKILALSDFFFIQLWSVSDLMCIGEMHLLWVDKSTEQTLASLRLYFLPENTPEGRNDEHGDDEVLAISEKVVIKLEDLLARLTEGCPWNKGLEAVWQGDCAPPAKEEISSTITDNGGGGDADLSESDLELAEVIQEKQRLEKEMGLDSGGGGGQVVVMSFARYCRYRAVAKRVEGVTEKWLRNAIVCALGGYAAPDKHTRILFCKDTFDYPDLEGHELLCNHLAPNLKGRPRRRRNKRSASPVGSESNESESSLSTISTPIPKVKAIPSRGAIMNPGLRRSARSSPPTPAEKDFLHRLNLFMKANRTPIGRLPQLGFKEIDLYAFYSKVQRLGGYQAVTANRLWKPIYAEMGGHQGSTSAATITRRHYERLLLPFEEKLRRNPSESPHFVRESPSGIRSSSLTIHTIHPTSTNSTNSITKGREIKPALIMSKVVTKTCPSSMVRITTTTINNSTTTSSSSKTSSTSSIPRESALTPRTEEQPVSKEKENIPLAREPSPKSTPELIDLASEPDSVIELSPPSIKVPVVGGLIPCTRPTVKKRKLDILKQGGLEVTAVTHTSVGSVTITAERQHTSCSSSTSSSPSSSSPSSSSVTANNNYYRPSSSNDKQVCITVTPDLGHLLPPASIEPNYSPNSSSSSTSPMSSNHHTHPIQSRSIYEHSQSVVYGNPKETFNSNFKPSLSGEVLDLRTKRGSGPTSFTVVGSNLEISVIDHVPKKQRSSASSANVTTTPPATVTPLNIPSRGGGSAQHAYAPKTAPFMSVPLIEPLYYPAFFTSQYASQHQLQFYKQLLGQRAASLLGLPRDGSTSITPVESNHRNSHSQ